MPQQLMSEWLLKEKIDELQNKSNLTSQEKMFLSLCQKEIEVIKRLKLFGIDMTGNCKDVTERLKYQEIHFFGKGQYDLICAKAKIYDMISDLVKEKEDEYVCTENCGNYL